MRLASKGLGKVTLPFRLAEARITEGDGFLVLEGLIKEQNVNWTYRAELEDSDILNFLILARRPVVAGYIARRTGAGLFARATSSALRLILRRLRPTVEASRMAQAPVATQTGQGPTRGAQSP